MTSGQYYIINIININATLHTEYYNMNKISVSLSLCLSVSLSLSPHTLCLLMSFADIKSFTENCFKLLHYVLVGPIDK